MDKETMTVLDDLKASVTRELRLLNKKDTLSPTEIKAATDAVCLLLKIKMVEEGGSEYDMDSNSFTYWGGDYYNDYSGRPRFNGTMHMDAGRSPVTGRYISRDGGRYSGHSINDRMIARLEDMYDEAKSEHECEEIRREIERLRNNAN